MLSVTGVLKIDSKYEKIIEDKMASYYQPKNFIIYIYSNAENIYDINQDQPNFTASKTFSFSFMSTMKSIYQWSDM